MGKKLIPAQPPLVVLNQHPALRYNHVEVMGKYNHVEVMGKNRRRRSRQKRRSYEERLTKGGNVRWIVGNGSRRSHLQLELIDNFGSDGSGARQHLVKDHSEKTVRDELETIRQFEVKIPN